MSLKVKVLVCLILAAMMLGCAQTNINKSVNASVIAKNMVEKSEKIKNMEANMFYEIKIGPRVQNATMFYAFEKPSKTYIYNKKLEQVVVSNGKTVWIYDKKTNTVYVTNVSKLPPEKQKSIRENLYKSVVESVLKSYNIKYLGTTTLDGRKCYIIDLIPKNKTIPMRMKMWVDSEYWLPIKVISSAKSMFGNITTVVEYRNVKINEGVNESLFNFTPPKSAKIIREGHSAEMNVYSNFSEAQKHVNFRLVVPAYTAGLKLENITVFNASYALVIARYSDGNQSMIITEKPNGTGVMPRGNVTTVNGRKVIEWRTLFGGYGYAFVKDNVSISVISNSLSKDELKKVVESMLE